MEPVRLGIIGCGVIGSSHLDAASSWEGIDVVAVADLREDVAHGMADQYGVETVYVEGEDLLKDDRIEGVVLAMPAVVRTDLALKAFTHQKHVLTEKPVAMNADEVKRLIDARGDRVVGACSCRFRFTKSSAVATEFIAAGHLGDLRVVHCRALRPGKEPPQTPPPVWRLRKDLNGGGVMSNWGCYDLDFLLGLIGWTLKPKMVLGQTWMVPPKFQAMADPSSDAETHLVATIMCENGTAIHFERGEMVAAQEDRGWQVIGAEGSLNLQMRPAADKKIVFDRATSESGVVSEVIWEGADEWSEIHEGPVRDFARAIREGRSPKTSLEQALVVQQITDAIYASAEQGKAVEIGS